MFDLTTKPTYLENIIAVCVEYHDALVEMMVFHGARGVEDCKGRLGLRLEGVVRSSMIQIVAKTSDQKTQHFQIAHEPLHFPRLEHGEHRLSHIQSVSPIVVLYWTIILLNTKNPSAQHLHKSSRCYQKT